MARPAKGSVRWDATRQAWTVRVTLAGGARSKPVVMRGMAPCSVTPSAPAKDCTCEACTRAEQEGRRVSDRMRDGAHVDVATTETCDEWYGRYHEYQRELGHTDIETKRSRWNKWISPRIGPRPITKVTRDDVEDIRDALDAAVRAWSKEGRGEDRISGKTAMNVWSCLTSAFKAATSSKRRDLRALIGHPNPCIGVEPPGDRNSRKARRKPFVYPKEAAAVLACEAIPLEWRELHAIAAYTYLRPGELRVLTKGDVDLASGLINITKAWDYADEKVKPPKTRNGVRRVPIETSLMPLLQRMLEGKSDADLVVPLLSRADAVTSQNRRATVDHLAVLFRDHLKRAKVERAELHTSTRTHVQAVFRSWRDSGLTWLAMTGLGVDKISRRAGHDMVQTTMGYVKQAEDLTGDLGQPFGPLPASLVAPNGSGGVSVFRSSGPSDSGSLRSGRRDLNPASSAQYTCTADAREPGKTEANAMGQSPEQSTVLAAESPSESPSQRSADDALRAAIAAAVMSGDDERAKALLAILGLGQPQREADPSAGKVVDLASRRAR
jgi:integrase